MGNQTDECPVCRRPVLDHAFADAVKCAHAHGQMTRALMRQALHGADDSVDGATWTRAADVRSAKEAVEQGLSFLEEAFPALKAEED